MSQLSIEGSLLRSDIETRGYSLIDHGVGIDEIDALIDAYAQFTDNHPDPDAETMNDMIVDPLRLDELDRAQDTQATWNKYRTNHPQRGKPGGYTNRSSQIAALHQFGRDALPDGTLLTDDPKEFYHYQPNGMDKMRAQHQQFAWGNPPPEVMTLHMRFASVHRLARAAITKTYALLEETHPELCRQFLQPQDLMGSPLRLLFYHPSEATHLAEGHYDKSASTIQLAESHVGLRLRDLQTREMQLLRRSAGQGVFFLGTSWQQMYPENPSLQPGWHDVIKATEFNDGRQLRGKRCARWALIWFTAASSALELPSKAETHHEQLSAIISLRPDPDQREQLAS